MNDALPVRLSNLITQEEILSLPDNYALFFHAGVGRGKSYFCKNILYEVAKKTNRNILYIINRKNPKLQFQKEIVDSGKSDILKITTYQALESRILSGEENIFDGYNYLVFDEYHRFISDTVVDIYTDIILSYIYKSVSVKFFLSATPYGMDEYLKERFNEHNIEYKEYVLSSMFDMITLRDFKSLDDIRFILDKALREGNKVIYTSANIAMLNMLHNEYKDSFFICSEFNGIYYQYVDLYLKEEMVATETLPCSILFATTCMDIGFNVNDANIKYVICDLDDVDQITQCIGRRRVNGNNDKFTVYIKHLTKSNIKYKIEKLSARIEKVRYLINNGENGYLSKFGIDRNYTSKNDLIIIDYEDKVLHVKPMMMSYLYYLHRINTLQLILDDGLSFIDYVGKRLGCKVDKKSLYADIKSDIKLVNVKRHIETVLIKYHGKRLYNKSERDVFIKELNLRKDDRHLIKQISLLNNTFIGYDIRYRIVSAKDTILNTRYWVVEQF